MLHKNETRKALEAAVRVYVKAYLINNPDVTDEDKVATGLPVYSHTRHLMPVPHTSPQLFIDTGTRRRLIITYRDEGSQRRGKPDRVHGIGLLLLPPYAPNLNLIERYGKLVKCEVLNAAYHGTFEDFKRRIDTCIAESDGK